MQKKAPTKKFDRELSDLIAQKIINRDYVFLNHAKQRLRERKIIDIEILNILENKPRRNRKRNKEKDLYIEGHQDWNYCIEGNDVDKNRIRVIISFDENLLLIITVMHINSN